MLAGQTVLCIRVFVTFSILRMGSVKVLQSALFMVSCIRFLLYLLWEPVSPLYMFPVLCPCLPLWLVSLSCSHVPLLVFHSVFPLSYIHVCPLCVKCFCDLLLPVLFANYLYLFIYVTFISLQTLSGCLFVIPMFVPLCVLCSCFEFPQHLWVLRLGPSCLTLTKLY